MNPAVPQHPPLRFIAAIVLGAALIPLNSTMIAVALPAIGETFSVSPGDLTLWLVTSYLLVNIILQSPAGKLGDMVGRRRAFGIGLSLFAVGVLIATFAPFLAAVAASRILMAAGGAMLLPNAMALLRTVIPEERRPRAFGYFGAMLGAIVTDRGGLLSHAAIVAREYGIPGIVSTRNATQAIPDGARVRVDGSTGTVEIL